MILVRHGQSEFNVVYGATRQDPGIEDPKLTDAGRRQARRVGTGLKALHVTRLIVSPYRRTLETAELAREAHPVELEVEPLVRERSAFICDVGTPRGALAERWPHHAFDDLEEVWWTEREESEHALGRRGEAFRAAQATADRWRGAAVITHWGFIRALTGLAVGNGAMVRYDPTGARPAAELVPATET